MDAAAFGGAGDLAGQINGVAMNDGFAHTWAGTDARNTHFDLLGLPDKRTRLIEVSRPILVRSGPVGSTG